MNNQMQSFNFNGNAVRTISDNGEVWFLVNDICSILGYANPRDAIAKHCHEKGVAKRDTLTDKGVQQAAYINEGNLYRLVIKSRKPAAEAFERHVMEVILPTIRKTGSYSTKQIQATPKLASTEELEALSDLLNLALDNFNNRKLASFAIDGRISNKLSEFGQITEAELQAAAEEAVEFYRVSTCLAKAVADAETAVLQKVAGGYMFDDNIQRIITSRLERKLNEQLDALSTLSTLHNWIGPRARTLINRLSGVEQTA